MPYVTWTGIAYDGTVCRGYARTPTVAALENTLLHNGIGPINLVIINPCRWYRPITVEQKAQMMHMLSFLIDSGIYLDDALTVLAASHAHEQIRSALQEIAYCVQHGISFATACAQHPYIFDDITVALCAAAQSSGTLPQALRFLADTLHVRSTMSNTVRRALIVPALTIAVFAVVLIGMLVALMPIMENLYARVHKPLPAITRFFLHVSSFIGSIDVTTAALFVAGVYSIYRVYKWLMRNSADSWWTQVRSGIYRKQEMIYALYALALLLRAGVPLAHAIQIVWHNIGNRSSVAQLLEHVHQQVCRGVPLAEAFKKAGWQLEAEAYELIHLGNRTGALAQLMERAAVLSKDRYVARVHYMTTFVQPVLLILIGLLIVGMIVVLYVPVLDLSFTMPV